MLQDQTSLSSCKQKCIEPLRSQSIEKGKELAAVLDVLSGHNSNINNPPIPAERKFTLLLSSVDSHVLGRRSILWAQLEGLFPPFLTRAGVRGIALLINSGIGPAVITAALLISYTVAFPLHPVTRSSILS